MRKWKKKTECTRYRKDEMIGNRKVQIKKKKHNYGKNKKSGIEWNTQNTEQESAVTSV